MTLTGELSVPEGLIFRESKIVLSAKLQTEKKQGIAWATWARPRPNKCCMRSTGFLQSNSMIDTVIKQC